MGFSPYLPAQTLVDYNTVELLLYYGLKWIVSRATSTPPQVAGIVALARR
jgi:hypothetical protein